MTNDKLKITYNGVLKGQLNPHLLDMRGAWKNVNKLKEAHWLKNMLIDMMLETNDKEELKSLALDITEVEFELQDLWGFDRNTRYHRFWALPKCQCPKMDNDDWYGTKYSIKAVDCPLHGKD